jgi:hypothetical protein
MASDYRFSQRSGPLELHHCPGRMNTVLVSQGLGNENNLQARYRRRSDEHQQPSSPSRIPRTPSVPGPRREVASRRRPEGPARALRRRSTPARTIHSRGALSWRRSIHPNTPGSVWNRGRDALAEAGVGVGGRDTLAERIAQRPMPVNEAMAIARQIADALAALMKRGSFTATRSLRMSKCVRTSV